jgi:AcrR family transcriptional regulator
MAAQTSRERRKEETREALIDAGYEVFVRRGFEAASIDEIAETAGFTRGAFYKHFKNKDELLYALTDRHWVTAEDDFLAELAHTNSLTDLDIATIARLFKAQGARDIKSYTLSQETHLYGLRHPEMRERQLQRIHEHNDRMEQLILDQLAKFGVTLSMSASTLARVVLAALDGFWGAEAMDPTADMLFEPFIEIIVKAMLYDMEHPAPPPARKSRKQAPTANNKTN